jgi:hypothetical protein
MEAKLAEMDPVLLAIRDEVCPSDKNFLRHPSLGYF